VVEGDEKKRARLNCIHHLLEQIPYRSVDREQIELPPRIRHNDYVRKPIPEDSIVPNVY
jgi:hypothetical protein